MAFDHVEYRKVARVLALIDYVFSIIFMGVGYFLATEFIIGVVKNEQEHGGPWKKRDTAEIFIALIPLCLQSLFLFCQTAMTIHFINAFGPGSGLLEAITWTKKWLYGTKACTILPVVFSILFTFSMGAPFAIPAFLVLGVRAIFIFLGYMFRRMLKNAREASGETTGLNLSHDTVIIIT